MYALLHSYGSRSVHTGLRQWYRKSPIKRMTTLTCRPARIQFTLISRVNNETGQGVREFFDISVVLQLVCV